MQSYCPVLVDSVLKLAFSKQGIGWEGSNLEVLLATEGLFGKSGKAVVQIISV